MTHDGYIQLSRWLTLCGSIALIGGLYHQAYKLYKYAEIRNVSAGLIVALLVSEGTWINYGAALHEIPVWGIPALNVPAVVWMAVSYYRIKKGRHKDSESGIPSCTDSG